MRMIIATHLTMLVMYYSVSWAALKGLGFITGIDHANSTIFLTTLIITFLTLFIGYKEED